MTIDPAQHAALQVIRGVATELELTHELVGGTMVSVSLPGTRKLRTECTFEVGRHAVDVRAFVARHADENQAGLHRWLLERNLRLGLVAFAIDHLGDIHLTGRIPLPAVTPELVDQVLGTVAETADGAFNTILELGFASSIRAEWAWRLSRGESTANLAAFEHLRPQDASAVSDEDPSGGGPEQPRGTDPSGPSQH